LEAGLPRPAPSTDQASALALSAEDVARLLQDTSAGTRVDMTGKIASAYNSQSLTAREIKVAEQIFRLLLRDTELRVRATLAGYVKDSSIIPRDIVMSLAKDVEDVALPVLQFSQVLTDQDLLEIIEATHEVSRYVAISQREAVSDTISDTLIVRGNEEVVKTLVDNEGAVLSEKGLAGIIETYAENRHVMQAVGKRPQLPVATAQKLVHAVSSTLADTLKQKYKLPADHIDKEVEKTREKETLHLIRHALSDGDIDRLINQLIVAGGLTPSVILSSLCQGNFEFFETALARLSDIPVANARKLITDRGELGFRAIYNKSGLPDAMFPAVKLLLKIVHDLSEEGERAGSSRYANRIVERILQFSEDSEMENLSYIIALVRRVAQ
jgi:uncharacterized protein (DUF2336 family)